MICDLQQILCSISYSPLWLTHSKLNIFFSLSRCAEHQVHIVAHNSNHYKLDSFIFSILLIETELMLFFNIAKIKEKIKQIFFFFVCPYRWSEKATEVNLLSQFNPNESKNYLLCDFLWWKCQRNFNVLIHHCLSGLFSLRLKFPITLGLRHCCLKLIFKFFLFFIKSDFLRVQNDYKQLIKIPNRIAQ